MLSQKIKGFALITVLMTILILSITFLVIRYPTQGLLEYAISRLERYV
jgi:competence protein ComGF